MSGGTRRCLLNTYIQDNGRTAIFVTRKLGRDCYSRYVWEGKVVLSGAGLDSVYAGEHLFYSKSNARESAACAAVCSLLGIQFYPESLKNKQVRTEDINMTIVKAQNAEWTQNRANNSLIQ